MTDDRSVTRDGSVPSAAARHAAVPETPRAAARVVAALRRLEVTHVLGIPDNASAPLFDLLSRRGDPRLVTVTREGEAFAVAAGLWVGGGRPFVSIQATGLLESGDALRGTVVRMGVPLVCLVGYRGFARMRHAGLEGLGPPWEPATLRRPDVDSVALHLEPTLEAWGIPFRRLEGPDPGDAILAAWRDARDAEHPVALLLTSPLS